MGTTEREETDKRCLPLSQFLFVTPPLLQPFVAVSYLVLRSHFPTDSLEVRVAENVRERLGRAEAMAFVVPNQLGRQIIVLRR